MDFSPAFGTHSYAQARSALRPEAAAPSFAGSATSAAASFAETLAAADSAARAAMTGGGETHSLVSALAMSELAVETAATLRDKVVEAYQEILRMPV